MGAADGPLAAQPVGVDDSPPAYDNFGRHTLEEPMALGGATVLAVTYEQGWARVALPHMDRTRYIHHGIRFVVRSKEDRRYPE